MFHQNHPRSLSNRVLYHGVCDLHCSMSLYTTQSRWFEGSLVPQGAKEENGYNDGGSTDVDENVRKAWKEMEEHWGSIEHYTPG